ncbi:MAG: hypothetical protein ACYTG2_06050 [Planctomycetota bacterium]|jgi:hypothetical protein
MEAARNSLPEPGTDGVACGAHAGTRLPSGWDALDALLGGGWPVGDLVELVGQGRSTLALAAVARAQAAGQPTAWVDGSGSFCPATCGIDLARLTLVRPPAVRAKAPPARAPRGALLAADLLLRSCAFGLLVLDLPDGRTPLASWFRLGRQAVRARTVLLLLGGSTGATAGSAAGLTLRSNWRHAPAARWEPVPRPALELSLSRARGDRGERRLVLPMPAPGTTSDGTP